MTLSMTASLSTELLAELLATQVKVELSLIMTGEMVRLPSPVPGSGMECCSSSCTGCLSVLLMTLRQEKVGGGIP